MKVPYLDDVFKGGKIAVAAANKFPKYRFDALKKEFGAKATSYVVFRPDPADAAKTAAEPVNVPEPETSVRGKKASAYEAVANLPVWELVPRMFEYAKSRGFEHPYSYDEAGFVLRDGKRMKQLAVDFGRNKLHDFSGRTEKFSGGPRAFVNGFVTHLFEEFPRRGDSGAGKERRYALRAEFLRSEFGIS